MTKTQSPTMPMYTLVSLLCLVITACQSSETITTANTATDHPVLRTPPPTATASPTVIPPTRSAPTATSPLIERVPDADVMFVKAVHNSSEDTWTFEVTVLHPDTGWEDYADGWDVVIPDGTVLKPDPGSPFTRLLLHPHVGEQPFTRSQRGIAIPAGVTQVTVRAHDLVSGFGGQEVILDLSTSAGPNYEIVRQDGP